MSASERDHASHGRPSVDALREPTQRLRPVNDGSRAGGPPFAPRQAANRPSWVDEVTQNLPTTPRLSTERIGVPPPGELMDAGLDGARTFQRFWDFPNERARLAPRLTPKTEPTLVDRMFVLGANLTRLGVPYDQQIAIYERLANHSELIIGFDRAFKAETVDDALPDLPWDLLRKITQP